MAVLLVSGCTRSDDLDQAPADLGDFKLGHNVVVAPDPVQGPLSRPAGKDEWIAALSSAIDDRFGRYTGGGLYHLGISVEGYMLAGPGVPVIAAPKSALILRVTVWDDAAGAKLNETPRQITVLETLSADTVIGSGLTRSKQEQIAELSRNAAKQIETWLIGEKARRDWFEGAGAPLRAKEGAAAAPDVATLAGDGSES